jgi:thiamine biosynthesis lipoprotein
MACEFGVRYHAADGAYVDAPLAALDLVADLEDQLSVYRDYTEVSQINRTAAEHAVEVEPRLFTLLELCTWLHATTGGAFDITSGPLSRAWGFLKREGRLPSEVDIVSALQHVGLANVELDPDHRTIHFLTPGVEINFNAIGKGYALDRVAELLDERGLSDYLCEGGGSSVLARGRDRGGDTGGWAIGVPHPHRRDQHVGEIILRDEALGTSGAGMQFFEADGRRFGHLIDPRTGWPAEGVYTATAVASTAAEADALSTAFYINGPGHTAEYCAEYKNVAAVLVCPREGGTEDAFDVHVFNLDGRRWIPSGG